MTPRLVEECEGGREDQAGSKHEAGRQAGRDHGVRVGTGAARGGGFERKRMQKKEVQPGASFVRPSWPGVVGRRPESRQTRPIVWDLQKEGRCQIWIRREPGLLCILNSKVEAAAEMFGEQMSMMLVIEVVVMVVMVQLLISAWL